MGAELKISGTNASKLSNDSSSSISIALEPNTKKSDRALAGSEEERPDVGRPESIASFAIDRAIALPAALQAVDAKWFVRPPSGGQFGPAPAGLLMSWIAESRVTADSLLCQEGVGHWQMASDLLPELFATASPDSNNVLETGVPIPSYSVSPTSVVDPAVIRSGAILKKKIQKRRQQLNMVILLAALSFVLFSILIYVLVFQVGKPPAAN
jgi:hypothetical protein